MMFVDIKACSFIVTWFVPESIVGILKKTMDENLFLEYDIITLQIAGDCIYKVICFTFALDSYRGSISLFFASFLTGAYYL